jgi:two-component system, LytTR family, sensor kinase
MRKKQFLQALTFCPLIPLIGIINYSLNKSTFSYKKIIFSWIAISLFLMIIWLANQQISERFKNDKPSRMIVLLSYFLANLVLIGLFVCMDIYIIPTSYSIGSDLGSFLFFFRVSAAAGLIIAIQNSLKLIRQRDVIKLQNQQLLNENLQARLDALKQQINPHFLFNALSTLRSMVRAKDERAEDFILKLSDVYRQLLNKNEVLLMSLKDEVEFLQSYLFMLHARFEDMLQVTIQTTPECEQKKLPTFSLQLLVENCIKHNIISSARPLSIRVYHKNASTITVENNLQPKTVKEDSSGTGLSNLQKRYDLLQVKEGVGITNNDDQFSVTLKLV